MAIKLIKDVLRNEYETIKVLREVQILRHFAEMDRASQFVTRLLGAELCEEEDGVCHLFILQGHAESDLREIFDGYPATVFQED